MPRSTFQSAARCAGLLILAACSSSTSNSMTPAANVSIVSGAPLKGFKAYQPDTFTVSLAHGGKVTWRNDDGTAHTATADSAQDSTAGFYTGTLAHGDTVTVTFGSAGSYPYHCTIHGSAMRGLIVVTP